MAQKKRISPLFKVIKQILYWVYPRYKTVGIENLPDEGCIIVGNHAQLHGPIACELHFPVRRCTWCAAQMMHLKEVPAYAFQDFWADKPQSVRWLYRLASYLIAPLSVLIFNNAETIGVYHDARVLSTFRETLGQLEKGVSVVIFPEKNEPYNQIVYQFQDGFVDAARLYFRRTGKAVAFVPMYVAPRLKTLYLGKPVYFAPDAPYEEEKKRICQRLMQDITDLARALPSHRVVPYANVPKKQYPFNC